MLLPTAPGLLEFPFMGHKKLKLPYQRLAELWEQYYYDGWGQQEMAGAQTHMGRVIPVQQALVPNLEVLPYETVSHVIQTSGAIALADCTCRVAWHRCDRPVDVCLAFGLGAEFTAERGLGRRVSTDEAMDALVRSEAAGLVHCAANTREGVHFICNCCPCCCGLLGTVTRLHSPAERLASAFVAVVDVPECTACGVCADRCPTHAVSVDDVVSVNPTLCLGCGLCASACPTEAIHLQRKPDWPEPPKDHPEWLGRVAGEKGRASASPQV
jgi:electron transport complex protein RnfB